MNIRSQFALVLLTIFLCNCKSSKTINGGDANFKLSTKQLIKENTKQAPNFTTLQSKLKITLDQNGKTQTHTVNFRAKKGGFNKNSHWCSRIIDQRSFGC